MELEWTEVKEFFKEYHISDREQKELLDLIGYDTDIDFDDVTDYLEFNSLSSYEKGKILDAINHECEPEINKNEKSLIIETLDDEMRFETVEKLYNTLTLSQLEKIEKMVELKVI